MGEAQSHHQLLLQQPQPPPPRLQPPHSRFAGATTPRAGPGEIVEVQGGHIVRSTGRKDRHSKVCTAKGPRDRRVRLSAHTAIQFYDVQDRLGYDRPSKAVDWLMKNAKAAIDELAELPAWNPTATAITTTTTTTTNPPPLDDAPAAAGDSSKKPMPASQLPTRYGFSVGGAVTGAGSSSFLPPSLDSDAIADTIKSFFPIAAATATTPTQNYPPDLLSRTSSQAQDLRLSLQSFQDPIFHQPQQPAQASSHHHPHHHAFFSSPAQLAFDGASASWSDQHQRIVPWNVTETGGGGENNSAGGSGGFAFNLPSTAQAVPLHSVLGHGHFFTQRGPLQSSTPPAVRGWADSIAGASDHQMQQSAIHPSIPTIGFSSASGFSGFRIPARIQGEEEHDGMPDKPSSASSGSHH